MELFTVIAYKVNIFTTSAALPDEKQLFYAEAKYNSGIVIAGEICGPFTRHWGASRARSVQKLHRYFSYTAYVLLEGKSNEGVSIGICLPEVIPEYT